MTYVSFENLEVWKRSCRLAVEICRLLKNCKEYVMKDQMTRAAVSIASNIAEGAERGSKAEFVRFLNIAKGSAAELRTQVYIVAKIGAIVPDDKVQELISELKELSNMLHGLIKSQQE
jgi:four helix bundle protein